MGILELNEIYKSMILEFRDLEEVIKTFLNFIKAIRNKEFNSLTNFAIYITLISNNDSYSVFM
ncbi:hypothetical protein BKH40_04225 [Helicobacter sp. 11S02629-2]|nr:hypothetical protein BKH40_04225 [Helicobacter sp. 11S02629-2]